MLVLSLASGAATTAIRLYRVCAACCVFSQGDDLAAVGCECRCGCRQGPLNLARSAVARPSCFARFARVLPLWTGQLGAALEAVLCSAQSAKATASKTA